MKKLLALFITVALVMSMVCVNVLAVPVETVVWQQNFEKATTISDFAAPGGTCTGNDMFIQEKAITNLGASSDKVLAAKRSKDASVDSTEVVIRMKVGFTDLEENGKYIFKAKVMHKNSGGAMNIKVQPIRDSSYNAYPSDNSKTKTYSAVPENQWMDVASEEFVYNAANDDGTKGVNVRFLLSSGGVATTSQRFYVDDVQLIKIDATSDVLPTVTGSVFESYVLGQTWDFENLTYNTLRHSTHDTDQDTDVNGIKYIVDDPTGADNKVLRGVGAKTSGIPRNELIGFLANEEVRGKTYKISYKLYPAGTSTQNIRTGLKGEKGSTTGSVSGIQLVNGKDFVANQWNDISFAITAGTDNAKNLFFDQRVGAGSAFVKDDSFDYLYIDDIKIEVFSDTKDSYFKNMAVDTANIRDFEDKPELINGVDYKAGSTGHGNISIANEGYNSNYSLKISGREQITGRYKLLDVFKDAPLGSMYKVSGYVKIAGTNADVSPNVTIAAMSNEVYYDMHLTEVEANEDEWTKFEFLYIVSNDYQGNKMDEIGIAQEGYGSKAPAVDTIYIDNLCVEPVSAHNIADASHGRRYTPAGTGKYYELAVKFSVDSSLNNGSVIVVAAYDDKDNLVGCDSFMYEGTTGYCYYITDINHLSVEKVKVFGFDGENLVPLTSALNLK